MEKTAFSTMKTTKSTENVLYEDKQYPPVIVTNARITVGDNSHSLSSVTDVKYEQPSHVVAGAFSETFNLAGKVIVGGLVLLGCVFPPVILVALVILLFVWVSSRGLIYQEAKITLIRESNKIVCYEETLGRPDTEQWIKRRNRAQAVAKAIGVAIGRSSPIAAGE